MDINQAIANHLLGPSYVSIDSALTFHGLIPERVYSVTSMTTKVSRAFDTPIGLFTYIQLPLPYYAFGINMVGLTNEQYAMIASPENPHSPAVAKIAHAGIKRQGCTSGPFCPLSAVGPPLTFDPAKRFLLLKR